MFSGIIAQNLPILIAGPTASGKSALGLRLARECNGVVINADALQVYADWHVLTARPSPEEESQAPHYLYGHLGLQDRYSAGHWLNEVADLLLLLKNQNKRPIILGGTGLYFQALTQGLADIPPISETVKSQASELLKVNGKSIFAEKLAQIDPATAAIVDMKNPARTQRAWEVYKSTGKGLSQWQAETPPALIPSNQAHCIQLTCEVDWLNERINRRFDNMVETGAIEECMRVRENGWDPRLPSCQAIGAKEIIAHLDGDLSLADAIEAGKTQTRQYAKRQRTWFRSKMKNWQAVNPKIFD